MYVYGLLGIAGREGISVQEAFDIERAKLEPYDDVDHQIESMERALRWIKEHPEFKL